MCGQCARGGCAFYFRNRGAPTNRALASACSPAPTTPTIRAHPPNPPHGGFLAPCFGGYPQTEPKTLESASLGPQALCGGRQTPKPVACTWSLSASLGPHTFSECPPDRPKKANGREVNSGAESLQGGFTLPHRSDGKVGGGALASSRKLVLLCSAFEQPGARGEVFVGEPLLLVERPAQAARTHNPTVIHLSSVLL